MRALAQLQQAYFACYVKRDYLSKQPGYEKILYQKRSLLLAKMEHARSLLKKNRNCLSSLRHCERERSNPGFSELLRATQAHEAALKSLDCFAPARNDGTGQVVTKNKKGTKKWAAIFSKIEHLSEIIFSLNQLRFRVSGYAIFEICVNEMQALEKTSMAALKSLAQFILWNKRAAYPVELLDKIHAFEAISHRTLQIASPEPIIFLFFIQDLYALYDEINELS